MAQSSTNGSSGNRLDTAPLVGSLHSNVFLTLQTRHAQQLVRGRNTTGKQLIVGLVGFADRVRLIWHAAEENDPYADWWLLRIHDALTTAEVRIHAETQGIQAVLKSTKILEVVPAVSKDPFRMELRFGTPYGFKAARLLGDFDNLVRLVLTARHVGAIATTPSKQIIRSCSHRIRSAFSLPRSFRRLGVRRDRPEPWKGFNDQAELLMGVLPDDVMSGRRRAPIAPLLNPSSAAVPTMADPIDTAEASVDDELS